MSFAYNTDLPTFDDLDELCTTVVAITFIAGLSAAIVRRFFSHSKAVFKYATSGRTNYTISPPITLDTKTNIISTYVIDNLANNRYKCGCTCIQFPIREYDDIIDCYCDCGSVSKKNDESNKYCEHLVVLFKAAIDLTSKSTRLFSFDPLLDIKYSDNTVTV